MYECPAPPTCDGWPVRSSAHTYTSLGTATTMAVNIQHLCTHIDTYMYPHTTTHTHTSTHTNTHMLSMSIAQKQKAYTRIHTHTRTHTGIRHTSTTECLDDTDSGLRLSVDLRVRVY